MNARTYVTTSIPYVNAAPHVGHALELVQADTVARCARLLGRATHFQTGTDENAFKNVEAARIRGVPVQEFVDENSKTFRQLTSALFVSADSFIRTTEPKHLRGVEAFWKRLRSEDLYRKRYHGLYCSGCEDFYRERDLDEGRCPDHGTPPVVIEEENLFFRLSRYQQRIEELLSTNRIKVIPGVRKNEVLSFVRTGLQDFSVSRPAERSSGWGIRVPGDPSQVVYVWIDALINYLSGLGFGSTEDWRGVWNPESRKIHVIGKNVWKFHAVYWPALLLSAELPLPDEIVVHGFLTVDGKKISKTLGNTVDPLVLIESYGSDALRYFLLRGISPFEDGDFSTERLCSVYNSDLANGLGNLVRRITSLAERLKLDAYNLKGHPPTPEGFGEALNAYQFDKAICILWQVLDETNQEIQRVKPWELRSEEAKEAILRWLHTLHQVGVWIEPILPIASRKILVALTQRPLVASQPLFPRLG